MALQFSSNISQMIVEAGEAVAFEYQLRDLEGNARDLTGRAFRLTLYNTGDRTSYYSQDGQIGTDEEGNQFVQWVSDGALSENLLGKTNIYFEIAERLQGSKNVLSEGTVAVKQSAPGVPTLSAAPISRFVWRIVRTCDGTGSGTPSYSKSRVPLVLVGSGPTLKALALSSTMFTAADSFSVAIQNATSGSTISATSSDGTTLAVSGTTLSGSFPNAGTPTITLKEVLAGSTNSPNSTSIPVTVAAPATSLGTLGLSSTSFVAGSQTNVTITGATAGSTISATSSDGTALAVNGISLTGTFTAAGAITITLVETLAGAINSPRISGVSATVSSASVPDNPPDLSGSGTIYGAPGSIFPLGLYLGSIAGDTQFTFANPDGLPVKILTETETVEPVASTWTTSDANGPWTPAGPAFPAGDTIRKADNGGTWGYANGRLIANKDTYLKTDALDMEFPTSSDDAKTQIPPSIRIGFKGIVPAGTSDGTLIALADYGLGNFSLAPHWTGTLNVAISRNDSYIEYPGPAMDLDLGNEHFYEAEWINDASGAGGTLHYYIDGVEQGTGTATTIKPRITPAMGVQCNASGDNTSGSINNLAITSLLVSFGRTVTSQSYAAVANGTITAADLQSLVIDATAITSAQSAKTLTYTQAGSTDTQTVSVVIGEMDVPAGQAYKVVLEDWSSGSAVPHPNQLVMTKVAKQNVRFEDATLHDTQAAWTEVLPQGPVPTINGINYYCEGVRIGTYTQLQFGYDWSTDTMPNAPFGDPTGKETYMVPHKWKIYDKTGALIGTVEKPNGEPMNAPSTKPVWEGEYDGRNAPKITADNPHYPHGTVRSGIIWRSHDPVAYSQRHIWNTVPTYDFRVPFASQVGYAVNGFDLRAFSGPQHGQSNGFANYRWMSWEPTTWQGIQDQAAQSLNPWKVGLGNIPYSMPPNAPVSLKYAPWNSMGRSPITAPGGTRDDRQIMPEMVARYALDVNSVRLHDNLPNKQIALHYLTGYVSDACHPVENGRFTPLFKSNPRRNITMRNHYYGPGEASTPASSAYYVQGGQVSEIAASENPLRAHVPGGGKTADRPYFGTFETDDSHAHQYPHWGSMMWETPEFAMLGHRFWDQVRLYDNHILASQWDPSAVAERGPAWKFFHAAIAWKTASATSSRLYSRADVMDYVTFDFEQFRDQWYAATPGIANPPTNILASDGSVDYKLAMMAGFSRFGPVEYDDDQGVHSHDFFCGYWLQALHAAKRIGFIDALLNSGSAKTVTILNWMLGMYRKRIVGLINDGALLNPPQYATYVSCYWTKAQIIAAGGDVTKLPQTVAQVVAKQTRPAPNWYSCYDQDGNLVSRDGQANDQLLAGPAMLKDIGFSGADLDQAVTTAESRFQESYAREVAMGADHAGETWFQYHQATNNRPFVPPAEASS
jgi:hypothetical protein